MLVFFLVMINFAFDLVVLVSFIVGNESVVVQVILLGVEGVISSLLCYMGTVVLSFDIGKIILLKYNMKIYGQVFGLIQAFKYVSDSILI